MDNSALASLMRVNTFPVAMVAAVGVLIQGITDNLNWLFWLSFAVLVLERLFVQARIFIARIIVREFERNMMEQIFGDGPGGLGDILNDPTGTGEAPLYGEENPPPIK